MSDDVFFMEIIFRANNRESQQLDLVPTVSSINRCIGKQTNNNHNDHYYLYYYIFGFITLNAADFLLRLWFNTFANIITLAGVTAPLRAHCLRV